ncbi:MAG: pyruvate:ferredoxin (flavodoxin) oxidoreductase [Bacilli bacterium]|nr:pyruvate:ferredoxin (flavodoxin) oxidoreductase [Bacilli bacterium]
MYKIMDGNEACAYVSYNFTEVAGIYPITPASPMSEITDKWAGEGKQNFFNTIPRVVEMESEAGAAGMVHGSLRLGVLTTTYTASQGLLLMIPNMYKIAGELLPGVINVSARSLASHALSIFGDHQDIYAVRQTGFAMLATSSVQQVMDLTGVAHLSAIKSSIPFVNFFDGFRTSHEINKVEVIDTTKLKKLIDKKKLKEFRDKGLNPSKPKIYGTNQGEDIYFQDVEVRNKYYDDVPSIVEKYMEEIAKITGREYHPFDYYGSKMATKVIIAMGSVCDTAREVVKYLNDKGESVGLVEVHLYRPFSEEYLLKALPKTVKKIAVLDRTKEAGSNGEPLYLDVCNVIKKVAPRVRVYGGRYGLSSKNTTPAMIKGIFDFLDTREVHSNFTVGIDDDITNLSVPYDKNFVLPTNNVEFLIYGYGSDGMVSASKNILKITGENTNGYVQGYFRYDSRKSGGKTISNLRFGRNPIMSPYYVTSPSIIICTKDSYVDKLRMIDNIKKDGIFIINTSLNGDEILRKLSSHDKKILKNRNIKLYIVDGNKIAKDAGISGKISTIMEVIIFNLGKIVPLDFAINKIKEDVEKKFSSKGGGLVEKNLKAIDMANNKDAIVSVKIPYVDFVDDDNRDKTFFDIINNLEGDSLPVSSFVNMADGGMDTATSKYDKPAIANLCPEYIHENCLQCNMCSLVCPHGAIRPFLLNEKEVVDAPEVVLRDLGDIKLGENKYKFVIGIDLDNCTGCGSCVEACPGKAGAKALVMKMREALLQDKKQEEAKYLYEEVSEKEHVMSTDTVKGSQFVKPKFEFSGACAGCGETPYLKLVTQLFGDRMIVANATGCSSIYGASAPSMPYSVPWANSLFEDNAEYGFGMKIADDSYKDRIKSLILDNIDDVKKSEKSIYKNYVKDNNYDNSKALLEIIDDTKIDELKELKGHIMPHSIWMIGGDGWAYDIGYNGIDHVLANHENVNILVLDTEVYSNTGGQSSKSTRVGAIAKFSSTGKKTAKKDLARIALNYEHVYVGTISLGANPAQAIKVLKEAEAYDGPSIIIAYCPCIAQGIIKGMKSTILEEKEATNTGYFPLFHYNPETNEFKLDSKADFSKYEEFLSGEDRYLTLTKINKQSKDIFNTNKNNSINRYKYLEELNKKE